MGHYTPKVYPTRWEAVVKTASHFDAATGKWIMKEEERVLSATRYDRAFSGGLTNYGDDYDEVIIRAAQYKVLKGQAEWVYLRRYTGDESTGYEVDSEMLIQEPRHVDVAGKIAIAFEVQKGTETGRFRMELIEEGEYTEVMNRLPEEADGWHVQEVCEDLDEAKEYAETRDLFIVNALELA